MFGNLPHNELLRQYLFDPLVSILQKSKEYGRNLAYSVFMVGRLHEKLVSSNDEVAIKQSRNFLLTSITVSVALVGFIAFAPRDPTTSRTEMLGFWAKDLLLTNAKIVLLFCVQSMTAWWFLRRILRKRISPIKFLSLLAYFIGGPCIFLTTILRSLEFGIPTTKLTKLFTSVLEIEGIMGIFVIIIGVIFLCIYFWQYIGSPKWKSLIVIVVTWHTVLFAGFAADSMILGKPVIANAKEAITEHNYLRTSKILREVAEARLMFWLISVKNHGRPPTLYEQLALEPCFDPWDHAIVTLFFTYKNSADIIQPYSMAISKGPNGLLDFTEADLMKLDTAFKTRRFRSLNELDSFVGSIIKPYDPVPIPATKLNDSLVSPYNSESWKKVDVFATNGVDHDEWSAIVRKLQAEQMDAPDKQ